MNGTMDIDNDAPRPPTNSLHSRVYTLLIVLAGWFALAVWSFAGGVVVDYLLFIVSGFVFIAVTLPLILSRVRRTKDTTLQDDEQLSLRDWAHGISTRGRAGSAGCSSGADSFADCGCRSRHDGD